MGKENQKGRSNNAATSKKQKTKTGPMKEEISLELAEIGNVTPKQEPMTPNQREKSEAEKWYK